MKLFGFGKKDSDIPKSTNTPTDSSVHTVTRDERPEAPVIRSLADQCAELASQISREPDKVSLKDAGEFLREALLVDPECVEAMAAAGRLGLVYEDLFGYYVPYMGEETSDPETWAFRALELEPLHPGAWNILCRVAAHDRDFGKTIELAESMRENGIHTCESLYLLAWALKHVDREEEALVTYNAAIEIGDGWEGRAHYECAELLDRLDRPDEAGPHYLAAARLRPGASDRQHAAGFFFERTGDLAAALECWERGVSCDDTLDDIGPSMARSGTERVRKRMAENG